jgi:hypothetical protein
VLGVQRSEVVFAGACAGCTQVGVADCGQPPSSNVKLACCCLSTNVTRNPWVKCSKRHRKHGFCVCAFASRRLPAFTCRPKWHPSQVDTAALLRMTYRFATTCCGWLCLSFASPCSKSSAQEVNCSSVNMAANRLIAFNSLGLLCLASVLLLANIQMSLAYTDPDQRTHRLLVRPHSAALPAAAAAVSN